MQTHNKKIAILGFGRFGELLADLCKDTFDVHVLETAPERQKVAASKGYSPLPLAAVAQMDFIFLAVPISQLEQTLAAIAPFVHDRHVVIDVCSVKVYPARLMQHYLPTAQLLASHPMFGPDSAKGGLQGLQVALCPLNIKPANLKIIKNFWTKRGLTTATTTPEAHDKDMLYAQAFTYSLARIISHMRLPSTQLTTRNFESLRQVAEYAANDSEQLFHDMLFYNPYFIEMKQRLETAVRQTATILDLIAAEQTRARTKAAADRSTS